MMSIFSVLGSFFIGELIPQDKIKRIIVILIMDLAVKNLFISASRPRMLYEKINELWERG